jgi:uncharacterized integral membrane protein
LLRKIVAAIVLVPLAVIIVAFAVANRQEVRVSLDPFDPAQPAYSKTMWLFVPIMAALIIGVLVGGLVAWLRHGKWRRIARRFERELHHLRGKVAALEDKATEPTIVPEEGHPPQRLRLRPPLR